MYLKGGDSWSSAKKEKFIHKNKAMFTKSISYHLDQTDFHKKKILRKKDTRRPSGHSASPHKKNKLIPLFLSLGTRWHNQEREENLKLLLCTPPTKPKKKKPPPRAFVSSRLLFCSLSFSCFHQVPLTHFPLSS